MATFLHIMNHIYLLVYWLFIAVITLRVLIKPRSVPAVTAWLLVVYIFPLIGIIAYLLFGELNLGKQRVTRAKKLWPTLTAYLYSLQKNGGKQYEPSTLAAPLFKLVSYQQGISGVESKQQILLTCYDDVINQLVCDIDAATHYIALLFYIWQPGGKVDRVTEALMVAARRGVRCYLMLDSAGSKLFFASAYANLLRYAGVEVVEALPVNYFRCLLQRMDLRQHRKMVLIDHKIAYTGSMNMVDPNYFKRDHHAGPWVDLMVRQIGSITLILFVIFAHDWELETGISLLSTPFFSAIKPLPMIKNGAQQVIASGPGLPVTLIHQALLSAIYGAREKLVITTPYFVPSDDLIHALCTAAQRGVEVKIILPAINDSLLVKWASRSFFSELLSAGVKIYQFNQGLLHSKTMLVDEQLAVTGTVNFDMRSLWLNFELAMIMDDVNFGQSVAQVHQKYLQHTNQLTIDKWNKRPMWHLIIERICYFFSPLL